jgi:hypothetical protein
MSDDDDKGQSREYRAVATGAILGLIIGLAAGRGIPGVIGGVLLGAMFGLFVNIGADAL